MAIPRVDSYRFGQLVVDGVTFKQGAGALPPICRTLKIRALI